MADEQKQPFFSSVAGAVTGQAKGLFTGAAVGGVTWGAIGAVAGAAVQGVLAATIGVEAFPLEQLGNAALAGAAIAGSGGVLVGGATGAAAGTVTGWANTRNQGGNETAIAVEKAQEVQMAYQQGLVQGAMAKEVEHMQQEPQQAGGSWVQRVEQQRQAQIALAAMEPQGRA